MNPEYPALPAKETVLRIISYGIDEQVTYHEYSAKEVR